MKRLQKDQKYTLRAASNSPSRVFIRLARFALIGSALLLAACAGYSGANLRPGASSVADVIASMGEPALRWREADGREQFAYPRGPAGTQTFMAYLGADGRLDRIEPVLNDAHFGRIQAGSDKAAVLKTLGPPQPQWTAYFKARDELVWEWHVCDNWNQSGFFDVLFDATTGIVRTTYLRPDSGGGHDGGASACSQS